MRSSLDRIDDIPKVKLIFKNFTLNPWKLIVRMKMWITINFL